MYIHVQFNEKKGKDLKNLDTWNPQKINQNLPPLVDHQIMLHTSQACLPF